ncbi:hypothetical protein ACOMHN_064644 [Nucella lapillus]
MTTARQTNSESTEHDHYETDRHQSKQSMTTARQTSESTEHDHYGLAGSQWTRLSPFMSHDNQQDSEQSPCSHWLNPPM